MNAFAPHLVRIAGVALVAGFGLLIPATSQAEYSAGPAGAVPLPPQWDEETLELMSTLPIQDGGRVKPLSTYARFLLLRISGRFQFTDPVSGDEGGFLSRLRGSGRRMEPIEWLMACLFYPEAARHYPHFVVQDSDVLEAIGVDYEGRDRRDRYSYADLSAGRERMLGLAQQIQEKPQDNWSSVERNIMMLATNVREFEMLMTYFDFGRERFSLDQSGGLSVLFEGEENRYSTVLRKTPAVAGMFGLLQDEAEEVAPDRREAEIDAIMRLLHELDQVSQSATALALLPPVGLLAQHNEWLTPGDMALVALQAPEPVDEQVELLAALEPLPMLRDDPEAFKAQLREFHERVSAAAADRGEYAGVPSEASYYNWNLLGWSLALYVLSFVVVAILWLWPMNRALNWGAFATIILPTLLLVAAIAWRCYIRGRPPVTTLYETILFTTAVGVVIATATEYMNRQKIAISVAAFLGMFGMFLANRYEIHEGVDTMPSLIAVLDTNFWLTIHVITIIIGYAGCLVAAAMGHVYLFGKLFGYKAGDKKFYRSITRMTYGAVCFGLLFSVVGTILGGIWANDSWGRFWGWDPKENGALMIVLWALFMLHGRMGGYLRDFGINLASIVLGMIVAFAWWGTNLLGVGLHSYGFTTGIFGALLTFYIAQTLVLMLGGVAWLKDQGMLSFSRPQKAPPAQQTMEELQGK